MGTPYRLGINMAGAISAGAYTAGVFDFLIEAIDAWEAAKNAGEAVPRHDISIDILTGASAGGICTALGSVSFFDPPNPCPGQGKPWANPSRLYKAWVQQIRIQDLVATDDLAGKDSLMDLTALLNSSTLQRIADNTFTAPAAPYRRRSVSEKLRLLLTLTSLRGVPYDVNSSNDGTFFERTDYYADQMQFSFNAVDSGNPTVSGILDIGNPNAPAWPLARTCAIATAAVPVVLAPQVMTRDKQDYANRSWTVSTDPEAQPTACETSQLICPAWDADPRNFDVTYVDGGATNNSPFECARRYIASLSGQTQNERAPEKANASVLTIAPFPGDQGFDPNWNAASHKNILQAVLALKDALIGQARFLGESLALGQRADIASRYMIVPKDDTANGAPAIQSASLGAFGGFFSETFRDHDYHLGRYNCQRFLQEWFVLPCENPVIAGGLGQQREEVISAFKADAAPEGKPRGGATTEAWMPIIPLCGKLRDPLPVPPIKKMAPDELNTILDAAFGRITELLKLLVKPFPGGGLAGTLFAGHVTKTKIRAKVEPGIRANLVQYRCLDEASK